MRRCIHALKYNRQRSLSQPLGHLLYQTYQQRCIQADILIPVPLYPQREKQRGYNQALLLAEYCALFLQLPLQPQLLRRIRPTEAQVNLSGAERRVNVQGAFQASADASAHLLGKRVLLIDDVCTTGATLEACAKPLWLSGALEVNALVLASPH
ncbi:hypothetical protein KTT_31050 [Tengunoibacter tsumagoiensis]|uniref:Phosphoribosyltransferase domain-containing protein n=1 Tax=Tengunoibacter tsumagoiensis TaxID=2014871 RepID=A0A402A2G4_9CHLR|nr:hypothetical protein KTT_31050 [Tengunoibacter tsumagoiensis]